MITVSIAPFIIFAITVALAVVMAVVCAMFHAHVPSIDPSDSTRSLQCACFLSAISDGDGIAKACCSAMASSRRFTRGGPRNNIRNMSDGFLVVGEGDYC